MTSARSVSWATHFHPQGWLSGPKRLKTEYLFRAGSRTTNERNFSLGCAQRLGICICRWVCFFKSRWPVPSLASLRKIPVRLETRVFPPVGFVFSCGSGPRPGWVRCVTLGTRPKPTFQWLRFFTPARPPRFGFVAQNPDPPRNPPPPAPLASYFHTAPGQALGSLRKITVKYHDELRIPFRYPQDDFPRLVRRTTQHIVRRAYLFERKHRAHSCDHFPAFKQIRYPVQPLRRHFD